MRLHTIGLIGIAALALSGAARAQNNPFAGTWNITAEAPTTGVYWLEVKDEGGKPAVMFLNRGGSPVPAEDVKICQRRADVHGRRRPARTSDRHPPRRRRQADRHRRPRSRSPASGRRRGAPAMPTRRTRSASRSTLFDGKSLDAWGVQMKDRPIGWTIEDGA